MNIQKMDKNIQSGFTLLELMIALALGLIISAAAIQLFIGGFLTSRMQEANAELQNSGIFGLDYIARDIRLANYGVTRPDLNDQTPWGGIVLTAINATDTSTNIPYPTVAPFVSAGLLSHSVGTGETVSSVKNEWQGLSNVNVSSDQLTIQFVAPNAMVNCEGLDVQEGDYVVQRYFLRRDPADANTPTAAGTAAVAQPALITGFGGAGQIIMPRVDHFTVQLGARSANNNLGYYTINEYRKVAKAARAKVPAEVAPRIVSIKMAVLVRSLDDTKNKNIDLTKAIPMLNQNVTLTDDKTQYARRVYTTSIAIRNGMGVPR